MDIVNVTRELQTTFDDNVPWYTHTKKGGHYIVVCSEILPAGDLHHLGQSLVLYKNSDGEMFARTSESFYQSFSQIP